jgi:hypothetical protein
MDPEPPSFMRAAVFVVATWLVAGVVLVGGTPHISGSPAWPGWWLLAMDLGVLSVVGAVAGWLVHPFSPRRDLVLYGLPFAVVLLPLVVIQGVAGIRSSRGLWEDAWFLIQAVPLLLPVALPAAGAMRAVHAWREWRFQREALVTRTEV